MTEHPILFSAPMIRAVLDGRKTQTRRIIKPQPPKWGGYPQEIDPGWYEWVDRDVDSDTLRHWPSYERALRCPYGQAGDVLWVRETFFAWGRWETRFNAKKARDEWHFIDMTLECGHQYAYAADGWNYAPYRRTAGPMPAWWKRPAIFMPRHASRITLRIKSVRVERVQDISAADALAEGVNVHLDHHDKPSTSRYSPVAAFRDLWDGLNAKRGAGWDTNPFVWRIEFERVEPKP